MTDANTQVPELSAAELAEARRYTYEVWWSGRDGCFLARAEELIGVTSHGDTPAEAVEMTIEAAATALSALREWERAVPLPRHSDDQVTARTLTFTQPPELSAADIRRIRDELGFSQAVLARALGVDLGTVRNWEQGQRRVSGAARRLLQAIHAHPRLLEQWTADPRGRG
jgi:putative transcriptional regulator